MNNTPFTTASDYLYNTGDGDEEASSVWPIIDYLKPEKEVGESDVDYENRILNPDFLTDRYERPRIVEFYAPWCGHCRHFKPHYIDLGLKSKDLMPILDFFAVSCVAHSKICQAHEVRGYPTIKFFTENSESAQVVERRHLDAPSLKTNFYQKYSIYGKVDVIGGVSASDESASDESAVQAKNTGSVTSKHSEDLDQIVGREHSQINQNDIYLDSAASLSYALRTSIFMTMEALSPKQEEIFTNWMKLLSKTIPRENGVMKESLHQIDLFLSNMDYVVQSEENLLQILKQTKHNEKWTDSCKVGYTCGLWQLLHIVTIGLVHYNDSFDSSSNTASTALSTMDTADTIRDYIEYYFTCDECRKNFVQMYEACQFDRCNRLSYDVESKNQWKQLALWLWETHNDVNVRLVRENRVANGDLHKVTQREEQEARWPSQSDCPSCWQAGGGWNEDIVYDYLDSFYWPRNSHVQANNVTEEEIKSYYYIITIGSMIALFGILQLRRRQRELKSLKRLQSPLSV